MRLRFVSYALLFLSATLTLAQQPDCKTLDSKNERAECLANELRGAEREMDRVFAHVISAHSPGNETESDSPKLPKEDLEILRGQERLTVKALRDSQSKWRAFRESTCAAVEHMYASGSIATEAVPACKLEITRQRTAWLNSHSRE